MIIDAIVRRRNIDKDNARLDIYTPKLKFVPIAYLHIDYEGRPVKLVSSWKDIPVDITPDTIGSVCVNGSVIEDNLVGKFELTRNMHITCFGDSNVYVVMPEAFLK